MHNFFFDMYGCIQYIICIYIYKYIHIWVVVSNTAFFLFSPPFGEDSHFDSHFSNGLKPPTRHVHVSILNMYLEKMLANVYELQTVEPAMSHRIHVWNICAYIYHKD